MEQWKRLTDGQSQRRTAEIRGLGIAVVVSLATNLDALSLLVCLVLCASVLSRISICLPHFIRFDLFVLSFSELPQVLHRC